MNDTNYCVNDYIQGMMQVDPLEDYLGKEIIEDFQVKSIHVKELSYLEEKGLLIQMKVSKEMA